MEHQIVEREELITEKDNQIFMLKAQINILLKELDSAKKHGRQDSGIAALTPLKIVKKIRGGTQQSSTKTMVSQLGDYNETEATEMPSGRLLNQANKQGGVFVTTDNSIFTHRSISFRPEEIEVKSQTLAAKKDELEADMVAPDVLEKPHEKTPKLSKEEEKAKISQNIEEFKKRHLSKPKKATQGAQPSLFSDRRGSEGLLSQFRSLLSGSGS